MSGFPVDDDLCLGVFGIYLLDASLQVEHHGACGIDDGDVLCFGLPVGGRRLTVCTQQNLGVAQLSEGGVVDHQESHFVQPVAFASVVYDVSQAIEAFAVREFLFRLLNGPRHAETEA